MYGIHPEYMYIFLYILEEIKSAIALPCFCFAIHVRDAALLLRRAKQNMWNVDDVFVCFCF